MTTGLASLSVGTTIRLLVATLAMVHCLMGIAFQRGEQCDRQAPLQWLIVCDCMQQTWQTGLWLSGAPDGVQLAFTAPRHTGPQSITWEGKSAAYHRAQNGTKAVRCAQISHCHGLRAEVGALGQHALHIGEAGIEPAYSASMRTPYWCPPPALQQ